MRKLWCRTIECWEYPIAKGLCRRCYMRAYRADHARRGLCANCTAPVAPGMARCQRHLDYHAALQRKGPALVLAMALSLPAMGSAQKRLVFPTKPEVALAQVCVSECPRFSEWCCAAIHRCIRNKAQSRSQDPYRHLKAYSDNVFNRARTDRRAWIAWLSPSLSKPRMWPLYRADGKRHPPWANTRKHWRRMLAFARYLWGGEVNPCKGEPQDWGNEQDLVRYERANPRSVRIECGPATGGNYWLRPTPEG